MGKKKWISAALAAVLSVSALAGIKPAKASAETDVKAIVENMSVDEKIGQMLMPDFRNWKKKGKAKRQASRL